jgi:hypothetical protein
VFQNLLGSVEQWRSVSACGVVSNQIINWNDTADLSQTAELPTITSRDFDIRSDIGIIIIDEHVCADSSLTLKQKLMEGLVFEHSGPSKVLSLCINNQLILA